MSSGLKHADERRRLFCRSNVEQGRPPDGHHSRVPCLPLHPCPSQRCRRADPSSCPPPPPWPSSPSGCRGACPGPPCAHSAGSVNCNSSNNSTDTGHSRALSSLSLHPRGIKAAPTEFQTTPNTSVAGYGPVFFAEAARIQPAAPSVSSPGRPSQRTSYAHLRCRPAMVTVGYIRKASEGGASFPPPGFIALMKRGDS